MRLFTRSIRPPEEPAPGNPIGIPPASVGPTDYSPGDPSGLTVSEPDPPYSPPPPLMRPAAWDGWPSSWNTPDWNSVVSPLTDMAWACLDRNSKALGSMAPYLVDAAPSVDQAWRTNPDPDLYTGWSEFCRRLFWDYQGVGEAFVLATARYTTGWPARFHVVPAFYVNAEMDAGTRRYTIGGEPVSGGPGGDLLHLRYLSSADDAHGHGPLEVGSAKLIAADVLARYATGLITSGGIPSSVLMHPERLTAQQSGELREQWVLARQSNLGEPAVLSGGVTWEPTQLNPTDMALLDLMHWNDQAVCRLLGVPAHLMNVPTNDSMTYSNVSDIYDSHWRETLLPMADTVMEGLSGWLLPRGTTVELNADSYVRPQPLQRAQTAQIYAGIVDPATGQQALTVDEIRQAERLTNATPTGGPIA